MAYETETLLGAMRELDPFEPFLMDLLFPEVIEFDTEEISLDLVGIDMSLAPFVSPFIAGKVQKEQGAKKLSIVPPTLKPKNVVKPNRPLARRAGEPIGGALSAEERMNAIRMDLMDEQRQKIRRRMEWMAAQIGQTGKVICQGEDYPAAEIDFQRDGNNTITLAGGAKWDQTTAKPVEDLDDWFELIEGEATHVVFGKGAFRKALTFDAFKDLLDSRRGSDTQLEMAPAANHASFRGRFGGSGPEVWTYSGYYLDSTGTKQLYIPENGILVISSAAQGKRCYGAILDKKAGFMPMEMFPKNWENEDPSVEYVMTQSRGVPVPGRANGTLYATVY